MSFKTMKNIVAIGNHSTDLKFTTQFSKTGNSNKKSNKVVMNTVMVVELKKVPLGWDFVPLFQIRNLILCKSSRVFLINR